MQSQAEPLRPRYPNFDFGGSLPRYWMGDNVVSTHFANSLHLLFPPGERFFVRSVKHYLDRVEDPVLRAQVKGFFGQEGSHAKEHEDASRLIEQQGYDTQRFRRFFEWLAFDVLEKLFPPSLRLAGTAGAEHFTAIMAANLLQRRGTMQTPPAMQALVCWHAAEEIEHRAVAFDVLQTVNPSYALRVAGFAVVAMCFGGFALLGTLSLLAQERNLGVRRILSDLRRARALGSAEGGWLWRGIRDYLRRDFHPSQSDSDRLAAEYLASVGLAA
jgi:predicted metal-dependent hydrolase